MKYSAKAAADLKAALDSITPDYRDYAGLCAAVRRHLWTVYGWSEEVSGEIICDVHTLQESLTAQWNQYSGDVLYPLPGEAVSYYKYDHAGADRKIIREEYMWDRATSQYAELRWQLIEYLRAQCDKIIEDRRIADMLHGILNAVVEHHSNYSGICEVVCAQVVWPSILFADRTAILRTLKDLFEQWPEFSGRRAYPVCTVYRATGKEPHMQYCAAYVDGTMWKGEYGAARMRLLQFLIEQTRPE